MGVRTIIPTILTSTQRPTQPPAEPPHHDSSHHRSYGATNSASSSSSLLGSQGYRSAGGSPKGKEPEYGAVHMVDRRGNNGYAPREYLAEEIDAGVEEGSEAYSELVFEPLSDMTWRYMSRLYLLVPVVTFLFFAGLVLLVTYAWPPSKREQQAGQRYPHPFLPWPFLTGVFASFTVQSIRVPTWVVVSWLPISGAYVTLLSTVLHTTLHELARLATLPMIRPSPTSGFHSSYYLGLGWGVAEAAWGIVQGWEQLALYEDMMRPEAGDEEAADTAAVGTGLGLIKDGDEVDGGEVAEGGEEEVGLLSSPEMVAEREAERERARDLEMEDVEEAELERKVEVLERMRARRDLEDVIGLPFPRIPFPLHLLWRLDTLLLNLGLTLILSAYYFNSYPIYQHFPVLAADDHQQLHVLSRPHRPAHEPHRYLWAVWGAVTVLHLGVSLVWKVVGRLGVGAVTWGALIVSLGSVFGGLGGWGGLV